MSPTISSKSLPSSESATFTDSSFFSRNGPGAQLPSPADVRARSATQARWTRNYAEPPARFEELGLVVKFGGTPGVTVAEGQYMELVQGVTLEDRWVTLDRTGLRHAPDDGFFLGHVNREPLGDIVFTNENRPPAGPFQSVAEFHDWLSLQTGTGLEAHWPGKQPWEIPDPYRDGLPDNAAVVFTHADLHPSNIIVSRCSPCKIAALIDWRQSGWYPEYWECCKAFYTAEVRGEWMEKYIPLFLDEPACIDTFDDYARTFGY
ncbi:phosphotransferase enzyme family protein [Durotheca rogersii]|uniref:phosphotransferase enzyme family protein n=1 Tax=Durotheca rogersii TaxID=419775 RepID=UPI0022200706|nr:phosphotransferase enzyme family protein [Durotheca rogersii]KAI5858267.1 phosphotransferase enzyme family protein [Durotheca rogersii]